ncbi:MAG: TadE/TadG family type IV pilus assembly protein [Rhodospirillales bacterium]
MKPQRIGTFGRRMLRWWRRDDGNTAMMCGLLLIPMIGAVGLAVDSLRAYMLEDQLQKSLDAAGLAAGRVTDTSNLSGEAQQVFDANFAAARKYASVGDITININEDEGSVSLSADADVPTVFMRVLGHDSVDVHASTVINREIRQMELALVMDNTGSMVGQPIADEIAGAKDLIANVYGNTESHDNLLVALVPYTATVNVGPQHTDWLPATDQALKSPSPFADDTVNGKSWKGCVMARAAPYDQSDDPPSVKKFDSYLYPKDVDNAFPPVKAKVTDQNNGTGPNLGCGTPSILPLTHEKSKVLAAIGKMGAWHRGGTTSNLGLAWGWRVLSPRWRGLWGGDTPADRPLDYNSTLSDKVIVLLTDGNNQFYDWPDHTPNNGKGPRGSDYTAYGRLYDMGVTSIDAGNDLLDSRMADLCTKIKAEGIIMYTITYGATPDKATKALFQSCATSPDYYFHAPDGATMKAVFKKVGRQLGNLRISH